MRNIKVIFLAAKTVFIGSAASYEYIPPEINNPPENAGSADHFIHATRQNKSGVSTNSSWFAQTLASKLAVLPGFTVTDANAGHYNGCHNSGLPIFWMYMTGHLRSFHQHRNNLKSFLQSSSPCWFAVVYTREEFDIPHDPQKTWNPDTGPNVQELENAGITTSSVLYETQKTMMSQNFAWAIVKRSNPTDFGDLYRGVTIVGQAVAETHGVSARPNDIVAMSRPDLVFSHAVDAARLASVAEHTPFVLFPHHDINTVGGWDPSEMLVFSLRSFWERSCIHQNGGYVENGMVAKTKVPGGALGCLEVEARCAPLSQPGVYEAAALGYEPFFYNTPIRIYLLRMTGDWSLGVMRPLVGGLGHPDDGVVGALDVTRSCTCIVGRTDACNAAGSAPVSKCWGSTLLAHTNYGGLWVCTGQADVDSCFKKASFLRAARKRNQVPGHREK